MKIIVVDDDSIQQEMLAGALNARGHETRGFTSPQKALEFLEKQGADLLITDFRMPEMDGLELIKKALEQDPLIHAIILTAFGTVQNAVEAVKAGAFDYITKPVDLDHLFLLVDKSRKQHELVRENQALRKSLARLNRVDNIIGRSRVMEEVFSKIQRVAPTDANVLILGESGTGKELIARAIHSLSRRHELPFLAVNCAALPENLLESELFGHEKGAFTGAVSKRIGRFEASDKGTLFLDEIGDLPMSVQVKLLRFLQERVFERVGGQTSIKVDIRLIAATNKDLPGAISDGSFREDLYYRLNVIQINAPPLRERRSDIPKLIDFFIEKYAGRHSKNVKTLSRQAYDLLIRHPFPGNVRELENIVENAVVMARGEVLEINDLPEYVKKSSNHENHTGSLPMQVDELEKRLISEALEQENHVQTKAAKALGISERTLRYKMKKLGFGSLK